MSVKSELLGRTALPRVLVIVLAIVWLFAVIVDYYIVHKPFSVENALAVLDELGDIAVWLGLTALAGAVGHRLLRGFTFASPLEASVFALGIGWAPLSFATFALGLAGALNRLLFWGLLLLGLVLLRNELRSWWNELRALRVAPGSRFEAGLSLFLAATLGLAFLITLTPTLGWDAQAYHLLGPKLALLRDHIAAPPDVPSMNYPGLVEMLFLAALTLKGDGPTALIHLSFAVLVSGALIAFSARFLSTRVGWIAGAILCAVPSFMLVAEWPYNDAALAFYTFSALYALLAAKENLEARWFVLAGVCAGLALGMKYTAAIVPTGLLVLMWFERKRLALKHWAYILVACGLVAAPWYLRNLAFTGNPIYPFFFGGPYWNAFRAYWYGVPGSGLAKEPLRLLVAPWEATVFGQEGTTSYEATIGPLLLVLLPLWLFVRPHGQRPHVTRDLFCFSGILYALWLTGVATSGGLVQTRLLFPAFPVLALLAALALDGLPALDLPSFSLARFGRIVVGVVLCLTLCAQALDFVALNPVPYLFGYETRETYLSKRLGAGYWDAMLFIDHLPAARVYFLWEPRGYYVASSVQVQTDEILDEFANLRYQYHDAAGIARALQAQGYTHILLNRWGFDFALNSGYAGLSADDARVLQDLTTHYAEQVYGASALDYTTDAAGKVHVQDTEGTPYAVYMLRPEGN